MEDEAPQTRKKAKVHDSAWKSAALDEELYEHKEASSSATVA